MFPVDDVIMSWGSVEVHCQKNDTLSQDNPTQRTLVYVFFNELSDLGIPIIDYVRTG